MCILLGCFADVKYAKYDSKDSELGISMEYIQGWKFSETRGSKNSYAQVIFYESEFKNKIRRAGLVVNSTNITEADVGFIDIKTFADAWVIKRMRLGNAKLIKNSKTTIMQNPAINVELSYDTVNGLNERGLVRVNEKTIIVLVEDKLYRITFEAPEKKYNQFVKAIEYCIKTIKHK